MGIEREEHAVWTALLGDFTVMRGIPRRIVIMNPTSMNYSLGDAPKSAHAAVSELRKWLPALAVETARSFLERNRWPIVMRHDFALTSEVTLLSEADVSSIFGGHDNNGWDRFHDRYPEARAIVRISRVGFNRTLTQALVFVEQSRPGSGTGRVVLLQWWAGRWQIAGKEMIWRACGYVSAPHE